MLEYRITQAPKERNILKQCLLRGLDIPKKIREAPKLLPGLELYFNAFCDMSIFRQKYVDYMAISWETINSYCNQYGINGNQRERMFYHISSMDRKFLEVVNKKDGNS